ncbi:MAG: DUF4340 domain-containing protein [Chloroflexi bacterium]|nr:DUF4340 domain-containing protein [Chloroflexota bacterium]
MKRTIIILLVVLLALGGYFYFSTRPKPRVEEERVRAWLINEETLQRIEISLPQERKSQAFIRETKASPDHEPEVSWYFDDGKKSAIDKNRWGGMTLLLRGPGVERVIAENATEEKLAEFGMTRPLMKITLAQEDGYTLTITVGDKTPDQHAFYVQVPGTTNVATVDITWYQVVERLVKEPPYAEPQG